MCFSSDPPNGKDKCPKTLDLGGVSGTIKGCRWQVVLAAVKAIF
jgi:hypothetical protein